MKGIRKKITLGFILLAVMLSFSGMISLFELNRLSRSTQAILETSSYNMELSKRMLDAVQEQNTALLQAVVLRRDSFDSSYETARVEFESALAEAGKSAGDRLELEAIYESRDNYAKLVDLYLDDTTNTDIEWFVGMYKTTYYQLTTAIKSYMVSSQHSLLNKTAQLKSNAYRAITPGILTLGVAILMVLMFAFLLDMYYTRPIIGITDGLKAYVRDRVPFNVKVEGHDEIFRLREYVADLINMVKNRRND